MEKQLLISVIVFSISCSLVGCGNAGEVEKQRSEIASLKAQVEELRETAYKPGLAEIMNLIQVRHLKVYQAGNAENWELAAFEAHELEEGLEGAMELHPDHKDGEIAKLIPAMIVPQVEGLGKAIKAGDKELFLEGFKALTNSCNSCHQVTNHGFIQIKVPESPGFPNQVF